MTEQELDRAAMMLEARAHWMAKRAAWRTGVRLGAAGLTVLVLTIVNFC